MDRSRSRSSRSVSPGFTVSRTKTSFRWRRKKPERVPSPGEHFVNTCENLAYSFFVRDTPLDLDEDVFPNGKRFPNELGPTQFLFDKLDSVYMAKSSFTIIDTPPEPKEISKEDTSTGENREEKTLTKKEKKQKKMLLNNEDDSVVCVPLGNYLFGAVDILLWTDESLGMTHIVQIGISFPPPSNSTYAWWILPEDVKKKDCPFQRSPEGHLTFRGLCEGSGTTSRTVEVKDVTNLNNAIAELLQILEMGCQRVRPAFDGAILLFYHEMALRYLLTAVKRDNVLRKRFLTVLKGYSYLNTCVQEIRPNVFFSKCQQNGAQFHMPLSDITRAVLGLNCTESCGDNAKRMLETIHSLLGAVPAHANFFSKNCFSTNRKCFRAIESELSVKSYQGRLKNFKPLQAFLAEKLFAHEDRIIVVGMDMESAKNKMVSKAEALSEVIIRSLLSCKFSFDEMVKVCKEAGTEALTRMLQESFLAKNLINQSAAVIEQTNFVANAILEFFTSNKDLSMKAIKRNLLQSSFFVFKPSRVPQDVWDSFAPFLQFYVEHHCLGQAKQQSGSDAKQMITVLAMCEFDHGHLVNLWRTNKNFESVISNKLESLFARLPYKLLLNFDEIDAAKLLSHYLTNGTNRKSFTVCYQQMNQLVEQGGRNQELGHNENEALAENVVTTYNFADIDILNVADAALNWMLPTEEDQKRFETFNLSLNSLTGLVAFLASHLKQMTLIVGGKDLQANILSHFIAKFLANSNLNFVTLKSLHKTGSLYNEIRKAFWKHKSLYVPLLDPENVTKLVSDYFQQFAISIPNY